MPDPWIWKQRIQAIRAFNYNEMMQAGILRERLLHSSYSLTESRVILEISLDTQLTATDLSRRLGLDPGYLSRLLSRLESSGVIERPRSKGDSRRRLLKLTAHGSRIAQLLNRRVDDDVAEYLAGIPEPDQVRLMEAIRTIEEINESKMSHINESLYFLREAEPSDSERIIRAYETLYEQTFGPEDGFWNVLNDTVSRLFNPKADESLYSRCWIAEMNGESAGSILLEQLDDDQLHIKLFMVESKRRGLGIGGSLLDEAITFARQTSCRKLMLWTIRGQRRLQGLLIKRSFKQTERPSVSYYGIHFDVEQWELQLHSGTPK
ncbi:bifunctional helix-turn-helix transcriptional regulator/GNAT family N-acetyltransferase [Saccharibacillus kuerlensis]|uniref:MarR family transcriptional regulator n=1 Tax=Saccharibacillus kuerlensis TaxID=459527 RepID=A0ABQ2L779_9BACL|nr:helix-turn-helix domain-containing GNAT family N-acetyltransferase [Saccharibacillus kuerlensis]GGO05598.1 MarR family transcriptional regulator [Saccharibacillus kuerlensis]